MNYKELKALRQLLGLECSEAAEHVGNVSTRTWQRWEDGTRSIPDDVADKVSELGTARDAMVDKFFDQCRNEGDFITLTFYMSIDEYEKETGNSDIVMWKITNSVAAECLSMGIATLI